MPSTTSDKKPEPDYRHHPRLPLSTTGLAGRLRRGRCLDAVPHLRRPAPPVAQADLVGCVTRCPRDRGRSRPDARCTRCAAGGPPHFMDRHFRDQCGHAIGFRVEGGGAVAGRSSAGWRPGTTPFSCAGAAAGTPGSSTSRSPPFLARASMLLFFRKERRPMAAVCCIFTLPCCNRRWRPGGRCCRRQFPIGNWMGSAVWRHAMMEISRWGNARAPYSDASA